MRAIQRFVLVATVGAVILVAAQAQAQTGQSFHTRPVCTLLVYLPGGGTDTAARLVSAAFPTQACR